jgi:aryl-alcohol dehydrogenase-like predicted oxidoreductase
MEYRTLGSTGVKVSPFVLGSASLGHWGNADHDDVARIIHRALDAGINVIDTADEYSEGETEQIIGKALSGGKRDDVILATKLHFPMSDDPNHRGNSRRWIMQEVENSLRRLDTDWIDLYQVHRFDPTCDLDETLGALSDLVHAGKVRYIGSSGFPAHSIVEAQWVAERRGRERFVCEQAPYSMLVREIEEDVLPVCQQFRLGAITWSPLAFGWLAGSYKTGVAQPESSRLERLRQWFDFSIPENQRKLEAAEALGELADEAGMSLAHMAIAFVLTHPAVTAAIIGPRTMEQLEDLLGTEEIVLEDAVLDRIDEIVRPGWTINPQNRGWTPPSLADSSLRRRRRA